MSLLTVVLVMSEDRIQELKRKVRSKALETALAVTDQLEALDPSETANYALFIKNILLIGSISTDPTEVAELFNFEKDAVEKYMKMALEVGLMKEMYLKTMKTSVYFIPLLRSQVYKEVGLKKDILNVVEEHESLI